MPSKKQATASSATKGRRRRQSPEQMAQDLQIQMDEVNTQLEADGLKEPLRAAKDEADASETGQNPLFGETEDFAILEKLKLMEAQCDEWFNEFKKNAEILEAFYNGDHWNQSQKHPARFTGVNANGKTIFIFRGLTDINRMVADIPKRTVNLTFALVESEQAILGDLDPTIVASPAMADDPAYQAAANNVNLFFSEIFDKRTQASYYQMIKDILVFDHGVLVINWNKVKAESHKVPFELRRENVRKIKADSEANDWSEVRWVVRELDVTGYQLLSIYPECGLSDKDSFKTIPIKEYYVRNEETGGWKKIVVYRQEIIMRTADDEELPVLPFEVFRIYAPIKGWYGISEVQNVIEEQVILNKNASLMDYSVSLGAFPPLEVDGGVVLPRDGRPVLFPGKVIPKQKDIPYGTQSIRPIQAQSMGPDAFKNARETADGDMQKISGITQGLQGQRSAGVYSARYAKMLDENASTRIRGKEYWLKYALTCLADKLLEWAMEDLGDTGYYEIYDPKAKDTVRIEAKDIDPRFVDLKVEVADSNLISATGRIDMLNGIKQYAQGIPDAEIVLASERISPGLFRKDYIKRLETDQMAQDMQSQMNLINAQRQLKDAQNPPPPPPQQQPPQQQNQQQGQPPQQQPSDEAKIEQAIFEALVQEKQVPPQQAQQILAAAIQEANKEGVPPEKYADFLVQFIDSQMPS